MEDQNTSSQALLLKDIEKSGIPTELVQKVAGFTTLSQQDRPALTKGLKELTHEVLTTYREEMASFLRSYVYTECLQSGPDWLCLEPFKPSSLRINLTRRNQSFFESDSVELRAEAAIRSLLGEGGSKPSATTAAEFAVALQPTTWSTTALAIQYLADGDPGKALETLGNSPRTGRIDVRVAYHQARAVSFAAILDKQNAINEYRLASKSSIEHLDGCHGSPLLFLAFSCSIGTLSDFEEAFDHSSHLTVAPRDIDQWLKISKDLPSRKPPFPIEAYLRKATPDQDRIIRTVIRSNR